MDKYLKIQSNQSHFTQTANLVDFTIPQGDVYDLSDSWVNFNWTIDVTEKTPTEINGTSPTDAGKGVYNVGMRWNMGGAEGRPDVTNTALVRDCSMECSRFGIIESLRRIDMLSQIKHVYEKSYGEEQADSYKAMAHVVGPVNDQNFDISRSFQKVGAVKSAPNLNNQVMVKLSDLMDICHATEFDTGKAGQTRIHFRLNMDKIEGDNVLGRGSGGAAADWPLSVTTFQDLLTATPANRITLGTGSADTNILSLEDVPYWVGQKCGITFAHNAVPENIGYGVISEIIWDKQAGGAGKYTLVFEKDWAVPATVALPITGIIVEPNVSATQTPRLNGVQLVLKRVAQPVGGNVLNYTTYSTDQGYGSNQTAFSQVFPTEGDATALIMAFENPLNGITSTLDYLQSYQVSVDNVPQTDRFIQSLSALHNDMLASTFRRIGSSLRNLTKNIGSVMDTTWADTTNSQHNPGVAYTIIGLPLPVTPEQKQVQLQINVDSSTGNPGPGTNQVGIGHYALFKAIPKSLQY